MTTDTSCGAVNSMHDSFMPLGGLIPLVNMQLGEIIFGGVGSGLYGMIVFVVLTVFIAGLMVGRTPEYLGKKIERREVQFAMLAVLVLPIWPRADRDRGGCCQRAGDARQQRRRTAFPRSSTRSRRPTSNNGSAFAGLGPNLFYNLLTGVVMLFGRFAVADSGARARRIARRQESIPESAGTFTTHSPIFVALLIGVILIVGALTFFPADALGPIVEHLLMLQGKTF